MYSLKARNGSTPTPPTEEMKILKTKAKLRNECCATCLNFVPKIRPKKGFCEKHMHGKKLTGWCRYYDPSSKKVAMLKAFLY